MTSLSQEAIEGIVACEKMYIDAVVDLISKHGPDAHDLYAQAIHELCGKFLEDGLELSHVLQAGTNNPDADVPISGPAGQWLDGFLSGSQAAANYFHDQGGPNE